MNDRQPPNPPPRSDIAAVASAAGLCTLSPRELRLFAAVMWAAGLVCGALFMAAWRTW